MRGAGRGSLIFFYKMKKCGEAQISAHCLISSWPPSRSQLCYRGWEDRVWGHGVWCSCLHWLDTAEAHSASISPLQLMCKKVIFSTTFCRDPACILRAQSWATEKCCDGLESLATPGCSWEQAKPMFWSVALWSYFPWSAWAKSTCDLKQPMVAVKDYKETVFSSSAPMSPSLLMAESTCHSALSLQTRPSTRDKGHVTHEEALKHNHQQKSGFSHCCQNGI